MLLSLGALNRPAAGRRLLALATVAMLACSHHAAAQRYYANRHKGHRLFAWMSGGYARLDLHLSSIATLGSAGGNLGAGYGYSFSDHLAVNVGVEYSQLGSSTKPVSFETERQMSDTEGDLFTMRYSFSRFRERQRAHFINIMPASVEYADGRLYCAAGAKVGVHIGATSITAADMETMGDYLSYLPPFKEMPDHYFTQTSIRTENNINLKVNITASVEAGINVARRAQKSNPLRIALFCDYGLNNITKQSAGMEQIKYGENPVKVSFNSTAQSASNRTTSLIAGVKMTLFFKSPNTKRIYPCFCP
jgi:opacity protein-like surface antigen